MHKITVVAIAAGLVGAPVCDAHAGSNTNGVFGFLNSNGTFRPLRTETRTPKAAPTTYTPYGSTNTGDLNLLGASMTKALLPFAPAPVTSMRAGMSETKVWP
jgi:hypothetical protein